MAFAGPLRHGGHPITGGTRYILVLFMYVENFAYHSLLLSHCDRQEANETRESEKAVKERKEEQEKLDDCRLVKSCRSSRDQGAHSYVVYKETLELMTALNKRHALAISDDN